MAQTKHGRGTVREVKDGSGKIVGYRALLPRSLSTPPRDCANPENYQEPLGPPLPTRDEAQVLLDAAILELRDKRTLKHGLPLSWYVGEEIEGRHRDSYRRYKDSARANRVTATWRSMRKHWLAKAEWIDWIPQVITVADLQTFAVELRDKGTTQRGEPLSGSYIRSLFGLLSAAFERAKLEPNPARAVKLPKKSEPRVPHLRLDAQRRLFRAESIAIQDRLMIGCGMGAGLRVSELLALEVCDVHVDDADPHLFVQYSGHRRGPTKSGKPRRVELFEPGLGFWRMWLRRFAPSSGLCFVGPQGGYLKHWPEEFPGWSRAAGEPLTSHIMRHTYAVALLSGSWGYEPRSMEFVSQQLGHADITTTQRYYAAFESQTWREVVRDMTGRRTSEETRVVVTAASLLGIDAVSEVGGSGNGGKKAETGLRVVNSPHSPNDSQKQAVSSPADAPTHRLRAAATTALQAIANGEPTAVAQATEALRRVLEIADEIEASPALGERGAW